MLNNNDAGVKEKDEAVPCKDLEVSLCASEHTHYPFRSIQEPVIICPHAEVEV